MIILVFLVLGTSAAACQAQIQYNKRLFMPNIASSRITLSGQKVITVGVFQLNRMGPEAARFFIEHEKAHFRLNHHNQRNFKSIQQIEREADIMAYRNISRSDRIATQNWFRKPQNRMGSIAHGTGYQRANRANR